MARILVIEDDIDSLNLITYLLQAFGHTPSRADNGITGLELVYSETPDLVLCDVNIPGLHGYEIANRLKNDPLLCTIPLIAVTAFAMVGDREKILAAGFDGYITKPIAPESFVGNVESFLDIDQHTAIPQPVHDNIPETNPLPPAHTTILVVDNIVANLNFMQALFSYFGYRVLEAGGVAQAVLLAQQAEPDLILSDVHLDDESGFDFLRILQADPILSRIPFLFVSSSTVQTTDASTMRGLGASGFIGRPIEPQALLAAVESILNKHRLAHPPTLSEGV